MGLEETVKEARKEAFAAGMEKGEEKLGLLIFALMQGNLVEDARRASVDRDFREKLYGDYCIY